MHFLFCQNKVVKIDIQLSDGLPCIASGWGDSDFKVGPKGKVNWSRTETLQYLPLKVIGKAACKQFIKKIAYYGSDDQICAKAGINQAAGSVSFYD